MKCIRCKNSEMKYFYRDNNVWYCRKCIAFGRVDVGSYLQPSSYKAIKKRTKVCLDYPLSEYQQKAIKEIKYYVSRKMDTLVFAATGAGKTELVMNTIAEGISAGLKVGFAISRRSVVIEIRDRMKIAFPNLSVIAVCEGFTKIVDADLIVCTMHQLHRYTHTFDILIMDEVDAFPYIGNEVLENIALQSCRGVKIYLTATPTSEMLQQAKNNEIGYVELFRRPHGKPIVVPKVISNYNWILNIKLYKFIKHCKDTKIPLLVFVPTIALANKYHFFYRWLFKCSAFTSKSQDKDPIIEAFRKGKFDCLFTTTILERGITVPGVNVVVMKGDHMVFNEASLVQIIGRVGRKMDMPSGEALILCEKYNASIKSCVGTIEKMNGSIK